MKKQNMNSSEKNLTEQNQSATTMIPSDSSELRESKQSSSNDDKIHFENFKPIKDTPFAISKVSDKRIGEGWVILSAGLPASDQVFTSEEKAIKYIQQKPWRLISGLILACIIKNEENALLPNLK